MNPQEIAETFQLRPATELDKPFVYNSWLRSYEDSDVARSLKNPDLKPFASLLPTEVNRQHPSLYWGLQRMRIDDILKSSECLVIAYKEDPSVTAGFVVGKSGEPTRLDYVFVKPEFRGAGLATWALKSVYIGKHSNVIYTHITRTFKTVSPYWEYKPIV